MPTKYKTKSIYSCPNCGGKIFAWVEEVVEHQATINPDTGQMTKKMEKEHKGNATGGYGLSCAAKCGWWAYSGGGDIPQRFFRGLAGEGFNGLFNSLSSNAA